MRAPAPTRTIASLPRASHISHSCWPRRRPPHSGKHHRRLIFVISPPSPRRHHPRHLHHPRHHPCHRHRHHPPPPRRRHPRLLGRQRLSFTHAERNVGRYSSPNCRRFIYLKPVNKRQELLSRHALAFFNIRPKNRIMPMMTTIDPKRGAHSARASAFLFFALTDTTAALNFGGGKRLSSQLEVSPQRPRKCSKAKEDLSLECAACHKTFSRTDALARHTCASAPGKGRELNYKCSKCEKVFSRLDHLKNHAQRDQSTRPTQHPRCCFVRQR